MNESKYQRAGQPAGVLEIHRGYRQVQAESQISGWHHLHGNAMLMGWSQAARMHINACETAKILSQVGLMIDLLLSEGGGEGGL